MEEKKNIFKDIKEKTAGMPFKEKLAYLWEYYRIHFLLIVFGTVFIISLTVSIITSKLSDPVLSCGVVSDLEIYCSDRLNETIQEAFPESTGFRKPKVIGITSPVGEGSMYAAAQLVTLLSAGELNCLICDDETLEMVQSYDMSMEVTELPDCQLTELAEALNIPRLYYVVLPETGHADEARRFLESVQTPFLADPAAAQ